MNCGGKGQRGSGDGECRYIFEKVCCQEKVGCEVKEVFVFLRVREICRFKR